MSTPKSPYYYKEERDAYHWETSCSRNYYPATGWKKSEKPPSGREQCDECRRK